VDSAELIVTRSTGSGSGHNPTMAVMAAARAPAARTPALTRRHQDGFCFRCDFFLCFFFDFPRFDRGGGRSAPLVTDPASFGP